MGVVAKCKEELKNCKDYCHFLAKSIANNRQQLQQYYIHCVKKLCEPSYEKCIEKTPLGKLLSILA